MDNLAEQWRPHEGVTAEEGQRKDAEAVVKGSLVNILGKFGLFGLDRGVVRFVSQRHSDGDAEGAHRAQVQVAPLDRVDLPAQRVFDDVQAGDVILFNEGLLHNGRPNPSPKTRKTIIVNFGRGDAGVWPGYAPSPETLEAVTPRQREVLTNARRWGWRWLFRK